MASLMQNTMNAESFDPLAGRTTHYSGQLTIGRAEFGSIVTGSITLSPACKNDADALVVLR